MTVALPAILARSTSGTRITASVASHKVIYTFSPNKIAIVDPKTLQSTSIPESNIAWGDVVSGPDHKLLFANDRTNNFVQVISVDARKVLKSIPVERMVI
jgi:hypothetical protein